MNTKHHKMLAHSLLAMLKLSLLIFISLVGVVLILSEPISNDELYTLFLSKVLGIGALYIAYVIFNGSLNKLKE